MALERERPDVKAHLAGEWTVAHGCVQRWNDFLAQGTAGARVGHHGDRRIGGTGTCRFVDLRSKTRPPGQHTLRAFAEREFDLLAVLARFGLPAQILGETKHDAAWRTSSQTAREGVVTTVVGMHRREKRLHE